MPVLAKLLRRIDEIDTALEVEQQCSASAPEPQWGCPGFVDRSIGVTP